MNHDGRGSLGSAEIINARLGIGQSSKLSQLELGAEWAAWSRAFLDSSSSITASSLEHYCSLLPALACLKFGSFASPRYSSQQTSGTGSGSVPRRTTHFFHPRPAFACGAWCAEPEQLQLLAFCAPFPFSSSDTASPRRCRALQVPLTPQTPPAASTCTAVLQSCTLGSTRTLAQTRRIDAGHAAASFAHWILLGLGREQRCRLSAAQS